MILCAGINEVSFIHWMFTAPWIIPTYNIKRLEREAIVPVQYKLMKINDPIDEPNTSKKRSIAEIEEDTSSKIAKVVDGDMGKSRKRPNRFAKVTINQSDESPTQLISK